MLRPFPKKTQEEADKYMKSILNSISHKPKKSTKPKENQENINPQISFISKSQNQENINPQLTMISKIPKQSPKKPIRPIKELNLNDFLSISKKNVDFGLVLSGFHIEEEIELKNLSTERLVILVKTSCDSKEFIDLIEPVFSFRKLDLFEYRDKSVIIIEEKSSVNLKISANIPNIRTKSQISGKINFSLLGHKAFCTSNLIAFIEIPKIMCTKTIMDSENKIETICLAAKKAKKIDLRIPIKNCNSFGMTLEGSILKNEINESKYSVFCNSNSVTINGNNIGFFGICLKEKIGENGNKLDVGEFREILIIKVKNSNVLIGFALKIIIY